MSARALLLALALAACPLAQAAVYSYTDPVSGMVVMSNVPPKGSALQPAATVSGQPRARPSAAPAAAPDAFPSVSAQRQKELDGGRKDILEAELAREKQAMRAALVQKAAADVIARHNANLSALTRELSGLRQ